MSAGTSALLCLLLWFLVCSSEGQRNIIRAEPGQEVILPCEVHNNNKPIIAVEWSRPDLEAEYVLLYRDGHFDPDYQLPSYRNRVDLQDRQMKDGDVSLVLKNVKMEDTGRYECRVFQRGINRKKRSNLNGDPIIIINLEVLPAGGSGGQGGPEGDNDGGDMDGTIVGSVAGVGILAVVSSVLIYKRLRRPKLYDSVCCTEAGQEVIIAEPGQEVILPCKVHNNNKPITAVEWNRPGSGKAAKYVLVYRDGRFNPDYQLLSYRNRVDLQDRQMKDGDVSLVLKNVTMEDTGRYECRVFLEETNSFNTKPIIIIYLEVLPSPGDEVQNI